MLEKIYQIAKLTHNENKVRHNKRKQEEEQRELESQKQIEKSRADGYQNADPEKERYSKELLNKIKECGFLIESYIKNYNVDYDEYAPVLETYYCAKNNWKFEIEHVSDVDIEQGIWAVRNIKHQHTEEDVDFYCDLGCMNTSENRLTEFLNFLTYNSLNDYINQKYKKYLMLPMLLKERGYDVEEKDFSFKLNQPNGYLKIGEKLYVKVYRAWFDDLKLVVTNDSSWNVNSSNNNYSNKRAYYFDYHDVNDIDELIKCIEAFKQHMVGEIGFYENGKYYSNLDIAAFFSSLRDKDNYYKECWNHYHIQIEEKEQHDHRGYDRENCFITNKYTGLEIYYEVELVFNDAAQWSIGDKINRSVIKVEYDKRKNENNVILSIENHVYSHEDEYGDYDENGNWEMNNDFKVAEYQFKGSFSEVMEALKSYVYTMIEIHEIEL